MGAPTARTSSSATGLGALRRGRSGTGAAPAAAVVSTGPAAGTGPSLCQSSGSHAGGGPPRLSYSSLRGRSSATCMLMAPLRARLPHPLGPGGDHGPASAGRGPGPRPRRRRRITAPSGGRTRRASVVAGPGRGPVAVVGGPCRGRPVGGRVTTRSSTGARAGRSAGESGPRSPPDRPGAGRRAGRTVVGRTGRPRLRLSPARTVGRRRPRPGTRSRWRTAGGRPGSRRSSSGRAGPRAGGRVPRRSSSGRGALRLRLSPAPGPRRRSRSDRGSVSLPAGGRRGAVVGSAGPRGRPSPGAGARRAPVVPAGRPDPSRLRAAGNRDGGCHRRLRTTSRSVGPTIPVDDRRPSPPPMAEPPARHPTLRHPLESPTDVRCRRPATGRCPAEAASGARRRGGGRRVSHGLQTTGRPVRPRTRKRLPRGEPFSKKFRRRPTLPGGLPPSTIGAGGLNFRVRHGNGCDSTAIATGNLLSTGSLPRT